MIRVAGSCCWAIATLPAAATRLPLRAGRLQVAPTLFRALSAAGPADSGAGGDVVASDGVPATAPTRAAVPDLALALETLTPREVVSQLDRHIIGQNEAKRAVAIALRNRWRRMQLPKEVQAEIMPKNILMVGPTGCGKTEIARRLAKLSQAPFLKVEATKFTEVGFHGRDVDLIIRDLVEVSMNLTRKLHVERLKEEVKLAAEETILRYLTGPESRADTVESFRRLLRKGEMDERTIEIELPADRSPGFPGMAMGDGPMNQAMGDFLGKMMSGKGGMFGAKRLERQRVTVAEAFPAVEEMEMDKRLAGIDIMKEAIDNAEQNGIVFIDEIDKIVSNPRDYRGADASSEGVQRDLLPLVEGCIVNTKHGNVNTNHVLFICSGAFHSVKPADLLAELQGRLPIRVELAGLTEADLRRILVEPEHNTISQQVALIGAEGVTLTFTDDAISEVARLAFEMNRVVENIGARRLYTVMERITEQISFDASDMSPGDVVTVDAELVREKLDGLLAKQDLARFIL